MIHASRAGWLIPVLFAGVAMLALTGQSGTAGTSAGESLTPTERRSMRIVSVRALGARSAGVSVTVTFGGNIERAIGHGGLKNAAIFVFVRPKSPGTKARGIATRGPGAIGETLLRFRSDRGGVVRAGRRVTFFLGPSSSGTGVVLVKALVTVPTARRVIQATPKPLPPNVWNFIEKEVAAGEQRAASIEADLDTASCADLESSLNTTLRGSLKRARELAALFPDLRRDIKEAIAQIEPKAESTKLKFSAFVLQKVVGPFGKLYKQIVGQDPLDEVQSWKDALRGLKLDLRLIDAYEKRAQQLVEDLAKLMGKIELLIKQKCTPPVLHLRARFVQAEFSTHYTVVVKSGLIPEGARYSWELTPPSNDDECDNRGKTTADGVAEFVWYHGDDECNHDVEEQGVGHTGSVALLLATKNWQCEAKIRGTASRDGETGTCKRLG